MSANHPTRPPRLRSRAWFDNPDNMGMTALYLERYMNFGLSLDELKRSGRPIVGTLRIEVDECLGQSAVWERRGA